MKIREINFLNINKWANLGQDKVREIISESNTGIEGFAWYIAQRKG